MKIRAARMDRQITIQRYTSWIDDYGTPILTWTDRATVWASLIQRSTNEYIRGYGAADEAVLIFRIRWLDDVRNADRVLFEGKPLNIKEIATIDRRQGLELRCVLIE